MCPVLHRDLTCHKLSLELDDLVSISDLSFAVLWMAKSALLTTLIKGKIIMYILHITILLILFCLGLPWFMLSLGLFSAVQPAAA